MSKYDGVGNNYAYTAMANTGMDSFGNLYDVVITFPTVCGADATGEAVTVRCTTEWTPPSANLETYEITYRGTKMKRFKPSYEFTRELTCTFRSDSEYGLLDKFKKWKAINVNAQTGFMNPWPDELGDIKLTSVDYSKLKGTTDSNFTTVIEKSGKVASASVGREYIFSKVFVTKVSEVKFGNEAAEAQTFEVTFEFGDVTYPNGLA